MSKYRLGVDLGGTNIKGGIIDDKGKILFTKSVDTHSAKGADYVLKRIGDHIENIIECNGLSKGDFDGVGIGSPGIVDSKKGVVTYSNNLCWNDVPVVDTLQKRLGMRVKIDNDANVAALGEVRYGSGAGLDNALLITLGTGVGGGVIIDGKIYSGNCGAGAELGHMIILADGRLCTCGQRGCIEAYASATALIARTREELGNNKSSKMWESLTDIGQVNAKLAWDYCDKDQTANTVVKEYVHYLTVGLINYANIFRPQAILIGGGISYQGQNLLKRIDSEFVNGMFGGLNGPKVELRIASLKNDAGFIGAACL